MGSYSGVCDGVSLTTNNFDNITEGVLRTVYARIKQGTMYINEFDFRFEDGFPSGHKHAMKEFINQIKVDDWFGAKAINLYVGIDHDLYKVLEMYQKNKIKLLSCMGEHFYRKESELPDFKCVV